MNTVYSDLDSVAQSLRQSVPHNRKGRLRVVKTEAIIVAEDHAQIQERNLHDFIENVCNISWEYDPETVGSVITIDIHFHESELESEFTFSGSGGNYTRLSDLSDSLALVERQLCSDLFEGGEYKPENGLDLPRPDFAEIDSASISNGLFDGLADREFKYEVLTTLDDFADT